MKCIVVTPEKTEIDQDASFVVAPLYDGEYGIGQGHTPVVARIGAGELRITAPDGSKSVFFIEGGFLESSGEVVSILTNRVLTPDEVTREKAQADLAAARALDQSTSELFVQKEKAIRIARSMDATARKWGKK